MFEPTKVDGRIAEIQSCFSALIGARILYYETAEISDIKGNWSSWADLSLRLYTDSGKIIAVSWSNFDELWIRTDLSLPFGIEDASLRWVRNTIDRINGVIGATIRSVMIGRGEMSIEGKDVEIWTRLLIQLDDRWLEIFNALDENGYELHVEKPAGDFIHCT